MAQLNKQAVKQVAKLCRISITDEEIESMTQDMGKILEYVEQLQELDTQGVKPCSHVIEKIHNVMRDDEPGEPLSRDEFLANAPSHVGGMVRVPPIMKKKS